MQSAETGKHFGPALTGWPGVKAARARARGFDTVGASTYTELITSGLEPREFPECPTPEVVEDDEPLV